MSETVQKVVTNASQTAGSVTTDRDRSQYFQAKVVFPENLGAKEREDHLIEKSDGLDLFGCTQQQHGCVLQFETEEHRDTFCTRSDWAEPLKSSTRVFFTDTGSAGGKTSMKVRITQTFFNYGWQVLEVRHGIHMSWYKRGLIVENHEFIIIAKKLSSKMDDTWPREILQTPETGMKRSLRVWRNDSCWKCRESGHYKSNCPRLTQNQSSAPEVNDASAAVTNSASATPQGSTPSAKTSGTETITLGEATSITTNNVNDPVPPDSQSLADSISGATANATNDAKHRRPRPTNITLNDFLTKEVRERIDVSVEEDDAASRSTSATLVSMTKEMGVDEQSVKSSQTARATRNSRKRDAKDLLTPHKQADTQTAANKRKR
ncbi:hypothetical protein MIR68_012679 [Amoeboaphelidium protococcarum]|nr:hypothetical protein MIR68_012679 [Amoeboaphelidium protococcarum]